MLGAGVDELGVLVLDVLEILAGRGEQQRLQVAEQVLGGLLGYLPVGHPGLQVALNRLFIQLINALPPGEPIDVALRRELSRDDRWPDDDQVREGVATVHYFAHGRAHQQRLVLQRLESHLRAEVDLDFDSASLSIEHIMPQTLSPEWKAQLSANGDDPPAPFDRPDTRSATSC